MTKFLLELVVAAQLQSAATPPLAQAPHAGAYATPALAALVARAADSNRRVPGQLTSYRARVETEMSFVLFNPDGRETVAQVEQIASDVYWRSDGGLLQQVIGYRSQSMLPLWPTIGIDRLTAPPVTPTLYGNLLDLYGPFAPRSPRMLTPESRNAVHPFSAERDEFYRFSGGDTVQVIHLAKRDVPVVRIHAEPLPKIAAAAKLFTGDIYIDATRMEIVRIYGRIVLAGPDPPFNDDVMQGNFFVNFESAEADEEFWLPSEQRWEFQLAFVLFTESRAVIRVINRFTDVQANDSTAMRLAARPDSFPYGRLAGLDNQRQLSSFSDWRSALGSLGADAGARDFDQFAPRRSAPTTAPRLSYGTRYFSQMLRYNGIEGVFTGAGVKYELGDVAPGLQLRAHAGWAWREHTLRGGAELMRQGERWELSARGERQITVENDLSGALGNDPDIPPLIGDTRFFDRRFGGLLARTIGAHGLGWRFEVARAADRIAGRNVSAFSPLAAGVSPPPIAAGDSTLSRAVFEGDYWLTRAEMRVNPSAGSFSLDPGWRLRLAYEGASGTLRWQRFEIGTAVRRRLGRWTLRLSGDAGIVRSSALPPQALYQLRNVSEFFSSPDPLPFTGDRGAVARGGAMYTLAILNAPVRVLGFRLPGPAPAPYVGLRYGWTGASTQTLSLMNRFGWRTSDGVRGAAEVGIRFFGGSLGVGMIRPLDATGKWRFGFNGGGGR